MSTNRRFSPCVGICSTTLGDDVCRGCQRTADEVIRWNQMTAEERQVVELRLVTQRAADRVAAHAH